MHAAIPEIYSGLKISAAQNTADLLERARLADQVGLHYVWIGEHHRPDYSVTSPSTVLAAIAGQTRNIHMGSAATVLSTEDPVRVFQQFATLDLIPQGRAELTAGRGSLIESYPLFGARLEDYDALYEEKIDLLLRLNGQERISWHGNFRPDLDDALILPRPHLDRHRRHAAVHRPGCWEPRCCPWSTAPIWSLGNIGHISLTLR